VLRAPELDAGLPGGSHQSRAEGQDPPPRPVDHAAGDAAQGTAGLGCQRTLPAHVQLFIVCMINLSKKVGYVDFRCWFMQLQRTASPYLFMCLPYFLDFSSLAFYISVSAGVVTTGLFYG